MDQGGGFACRLAVVLRVLRFEVGGGAGLGGGRADWRGREWDWSGRGGGGFGSNLKIMHPAFAEGTSLHPGWVGVWTR